MPDSPLCLPRIVFDTNTLISAALLPNSTTRRSLDIAAEKFEIVVTKATWREFETRTKRPHLMRYFNNERHRDEVVLTFSRAVAHVESHSVVTDCRDPDDNLFLALALDAGAAIIVTGDRELLALHPWRGINILQAGDFVRGYPKLHSAPVQ